MTAENIARGAVWLALAVVLLLIGMGSDTLTLTASLAAIFAIVGLSLNVLIGYLGQLSLGHQGFVGIGGMMAAYVTAQAGWSFAMAVFVGLLVGAGAALLLGVVALRITGLYLALVTLVFGLTVQSSLFQVPALTNSGAGQPADRPSLLAPNNHYYYACLAILVVVFLVDIALMRTKAGRALLTIKENERVASAYGINVVGYKLMGFVISGALAGLGGALLAYSSQSFSSADYDFTLGLTFVLMTVVGGAGSREGVVIGSAFFAVMTRYLPTAAWFQTLVGNVPGEIGTNLQQFGPILLGALLLLLTLIFNPGGIAQQIAPVVRWLKGEPFTLHGQSVASSPIAEASRVRA